MDGTSVNPWKQTLRQGRSFTLLMFRCDFSPEVSMTNLWSLESTDSSLSGR
ncbi:hypothetical protein GK272_24370 [Salmonella enterica]|nr:hypothetical protein [Salmonella enterica]